MLRRSKYCHVPDLNNTSCQSSRLRILTSALTSILPMVAGAAVLSTATSVDSQRVQEGHRATISHRSSSSRQNGTSTSAASDKTCFTYAEVASHNSPEDCWLIILGKVYDVTSWVWKHPGGAIIYVNAGHDCTQMFESYHPLYVRKMLGKYCIGTVDVANKDRVGTPVLEYLQQDGQTDFYTTMKRRVESHFRKTKTNPRVHPHMFIKSVVIILSYLLCYYGAFFISQHGFFSLLCAVGMGFLTAQVGVSIQHDCNHGAYGEWRGLAYVLGASLDLVGASSFMWRQQHVVGHHITTNVHHFDPDIRVKDPDVRRVTPEQPLQWYHSYQHLYLGALYSLLALKSVLLDDFQAYYLGEIGSVKLAKMTALETAIFFGGKAVYALYMILLPLLFGVHSPASFTLLYLACQAIAGWSLALMFQVAHVVGEAEFPVADCSQGGGKVAKGWAAAQVATTTDFSHNSFFWTHFSGGLNYQIEHHLFPGICHVHYPKLQPIVKATCEEFGVPYHCFPTFRAALRAHFAYLKEVGCRGLDLRLGG